MSAGGWDIAPTYAPTLTTRSAADAEARTHHLTIGASHDVNYVARDISRGTAAARRDTRPHTSSSVANSSEDDENRTPLQHMTADTTSALEATADTTVQSSTIIQATTTEEDARLAETPVTAGGHPGPALAVGHRGREARRRRVVAPLQGPQLPTITCNKVSSNRRGGSRRNKDTWAMGNR